MDVQDGDWLVAVRATSRGNTLNMTYLTAACLAICAPNSLAYYVEQLCRSHVVS